ncbi:MAG TPA: molybdopterin-dependent oxidoreductase [Gaiellaceae bacterium]|nr:molybdopterin-dependent oxidoreductase [Gaiellaceae bacterium]
MADLSRRELLRRALVLGSGAGLAEAFLPAQFLAPAGAATGPRAVRIANPLAELPDRSWEQIYRDQFAEDDSFVFTCAPNDTHNCLLRAHVKNGVIVRISPTYGYGKARDLEGNRASHRWDPRVCQKGLILGRRIYGDRRVKAPMIRRGFKEWVDAGFPRREDGTPKMDTTRRGYDEWLRISWEEAFDAAARTLENVAATYTGEEGAQRLLAQGYDPEMVEVMHGAGVQAIKMRGGMPLLGVGRVFGFYRFANMLALLDRALRPDVPEEEILGSRAFDNYAWHTDLPPGHPMVTGSQTVDFDLFAAEHAKLVVLIGMNWICTKMPDGHWLADARLKGTRVVVISADYMPTANKADEIVILRPGTDAAFFLGVARELIAKGLYDREAVIRRTDLPLLVRLDTGERLDARDVFPGYRLARLENYVTVKPQAELAAAPPAPPFTASSQVVPAELREEWGDFVYWDRRRNGPVAVSRDEVGARFRGDPALLGTFEVTLVDGSRVTVRPAFDLLKQYLDETFDLQTTSEVCNVDPEAVRSLARQLAANKGTALLAAGMGPNHYFNADLFGRVHFLVAALTDNVGHLSGNVGSFAGNYRGSLFQAMGQWIAEDPFDVEEDLSRPARTKRYYKAESAHYWNYGDRLLRSPKERITGDSHLPAPTKLIWFGNSNSLLGNAKWSFDVVRNTLPKQEAIFCNEWHWTSSCEYSDLVFPADSWAEFKLPDLTASCTNPFLLAFPRTPLERIHDTRSDYEILAGVAARLAEVVGEPRMRAYWRGILDGDPAPYLQRVLSGSNATRGVRFEELHASCAEGVPFLMNTRTYPRHAGWEQRQEDKPWYTPTGRLELYRPEPEWRAAGESLPVWREPVDATFYEPNVILSNREHPSIAPRGPEEYGVPESQLDVETRQYRNVVRTWQDLKLSKHPLAERDPAYRFVFQTPKYRWGAHSTAVDSDWIAMLFGPFGDPYRRDPRAPWTGEAYAEINPQDAKELGLADGDYVWLDADPADRPYRGASPEDAFYEVARVLLRVRLYAGMPRGVIRTWFNMYAATPGTVQAQKDVEGGPARNPATSYVALFRHGSHQSGTRSYLRPTQMTDSMTRKAYFGHAIGRGFEADVHSPSGAPKESFVKVEKAEDGGLGGKGPWRPASLGLRPDAPSEAMQAYLEGRFTRRKGR